MSALWRPARGASDSHPRKAWLGPHLRVRSGRGRWIEPARYPKTRVRAGRQPLNRSVNCWTPMEWRSRPA